MSIDLWQFIAPLTPSAVTPHHEEATANGNEEEEMEFDNEDQGWLNQVWKRGL